MTASIDSLAIASSPEPASRVSTPSAKASWTAVLRSATRATRLTASISTDRSTRARVRCSLGNSDRTFGNSPSSSRVVVRRTPPPAEPSKPMMPSPAPPSRRGQRDRDLGAAGQRLGGVGEDLGRDQGGGGDVGRAGVPRQLALGEPEPVGGEHRDRVAVELEPDAGQHRQHVVATGRGDGLADGVGEDLALHRAARLGHGRQRRVVLDRHRLQAEPRRTTGQGDLGAVDAHLDRLVGQAATDVGEQPTGDQRPALHRHVGVEGGPGRGLVVEGGELQTVGSTVPDGSSKEPASISRPASTGALGRNGRARAVQATASARTSRSTRNFTGGSSPSGAAGAGHLTGGSDDVPSRACLGTGHPATLGGCPHPGFPRLLRGEGSIGNSVVVVGPVDSVEN